MTCTNLALAKSAKLEELDEIVVETVSSHQQDKLNLEMSSCTLKGEKKQQHPAATL